MPSPTFPKQKYRFSDSVLWVKSSRFSGNLRGNLQIGYFLQRITQISLIFYLLFGQFVKFVADFYIDPAKS